MLKTAVSLHIFQRYPLGASVFVPEDHARKHERYSKGLGLRPAAGRRQVLRTSAHLGVGMEVSVLSLVSVSGLGSLRLQRFL